MKKVLLFGVSVVTIFAINLFSIQSSHSAPEKKYNWQQKTCSDGTIYEVCVPKGDGLACAKWGDRTRNCVPSTN
ncbi:hypothetical protein MASR1M74_00020 [Lentimicrobium sp.]|jgi:hypothetical protein|nr:hypothetical protein [Lentimicrobiaceae bacterium]